ncbi:metallophosphoesterase [Aquisalimonas lutea]|uniref:metallophosphoesterase n=1 Tax=Aquisalimonas lutea TaxID=1327750 RepID=UPI0025B5A3A9|nr:metallophosphoesterase [Aquisalimonas lutea]MDN3517993.1 metallophosphoesterase [Aquisalimonas lutea]
MQLLAVGDLHLGRRPGRLPEAVRARHDLGRLGPAGALDRLVSEAVHQGVDVVAFAGDVVEQEDDFFEAYGRLRRAVASLVDAGITVVGVAGNHDVQVLPQLAREVPGFRLLGAGGNWESVTVRDAGGVPVRLHGWSFPRPVPAENPLQGVRFSRDGTPALGLLHCDRDQPASAHAPVTSRELAAAGLDAWLLGHIHKPDAISAGHPSGYLGSVSALRASETGARGPWLYTIGSGGIEAVTQWPLAPLRWEALEVDVTGMDSAAEVRSRILRAADETAADLADQPWQPAVLGLRVRLHGRTGLRRQIGSLLAGEDMDDLPLAGGIQGFVGRWWLDTRPEMDIDALARRPDPVGLLARRVQLLDQAPGSDPERTALLQRAREHLMPVHRDTAWQGLDAGEPDDAAVADWLRRAALAALDELRERDDAEVTA